MFKNIRLSNNSKQNKVKTALKLAKVAYLLCELIPVKMIKKFIRADSISMYTKLYSSSKYIIFKSQYTFSQNK